MGVDMHLSLYSIFDVVHSSILIAGACGWAAWLQTAQLISS